MKRSSKKSALPPVIAAAAIALAMAVLSALNGGLGFFSYAAKTAMSPAEKAVSAVYAWTGRVAAYIKGIDAVAEENRELKRTIADMEQSLRDSEAALSENERLRALLSFQEKRRELTLFPAPVTSLELGDWSARLTIGRGRADGLEPGMCAVDENGNLVGFISELGESWAIVVTLLDPDCEMGAKIFTSGDICVSGGSNLHMSEGLFTLTYLPVDASIKIGDLIVSAGKGGVFPGDIVMGSVKSVSVDSSGLGSFALVEPAAGLGSLSDVYIITAFIVSN